MKPKQFGTLKPKQQFVFQDDDLVKCHRHHVTNGYRDFPVDAVYISGLRKGEKIFIPYKTIVFV